MEKEARRARPRRQKILVVRFMQQRKGKLKKYVGREWEKKEAKG